jgi:hypothetical protein
LQAGSPAIDAGVDVGLTKDFEGNPIVGTPDIGAYEYQGGIGGTSVQSQTSEIQTKGFIETVLSWFGSILTGKTIKAITGYFIFN